MTISDFAVPLEGTPRYTVCTSPIGELLLVGDGESLNGLYMLPDQRHGPAIRAEWRSDPGLFREAKSQLAAYFAGELRSFDLPLAPRGTPFQLAVWRGLTTIPYGCTTSYGALAAAVGRPTASRAVGMANGRNPISVVIPCHRVIGADGSLTGYGGGLDRKRHLLSLERSLLA
jgi:methylated-DNA-[protein]-cysteine S-methyltransferase